MYYNKVIICMWEISEYKTKDFYIYIHRTVILARIECKGAS